MTIPAPTWACHSSGWEHGDTTQSLTSDAIYAALPRAAKLGFKAVCCIDWPGPTGLQREAIKRIRMRASKLKMAFIPGLVMSAPDMNDRSSPAVWTSVFAELDWWKSRGVRHFALDAEDLWGQNSQDVYSDDPAENGKPLQSEMQVYQSVTAIRWGLSECARTGYTMLAYGVSWRATLNRRSKLLTDTLAGQWPSGAVCVHYDPPPPASVSFIKLWPHPKMPDGVTPAQFMAQAQAGDWYYSPCWDAFP